MVLQSCGDLVVYRRSKSSQIDNGVPMWDVIYFVHRELPVIVVVQPAIVELDAMRGSFSVASRDLHVLRERHYCALCADAKDADSSIVAGQPSLSGRHDVAEVRLWQAAGIILDSNSLLC